jgi:hypothetical protein
MNTLARFVLTPLIASILLFAGCNKTFTHSRSDWTINNQRTISVNDNGLTRKIEMTSDVQIEGGRVTKFPNSALIKLHESGSPDQRDAELRDNAGTLELWVKRDGEFRKAAPEDDAWLQRFLKEVMGK